MSVDWSPPSQECLEYWASVRAGTYQTKTREFRDDSAKAYMKRAAIDGAVSDERALSARRNMYAAFAAVEQLKAHIENTN